MWNFRTDKKLLCNISQKRPYNIQVINELLVLFHKIFTEMQFKEDICRKAHPNDPTVIFLCGPFACNGPDSYGLPIGLSDLSVAVMKERTLVFYHI